SSLWRRRDYFPTVSAKPETTAGIRVVFFFSSRRRHTRWPRDWSSDVCSSDLKRVGDARRQEGQFTLDLAKLNVQIGDVVSIGIEIGRASCRERWRKRWAPH